MKMYTMYKSAFITKKIYSLNSLKIFIREKPVVVAWLNATPIVSCI